MRIPDQARCRHVDLRGVVRDGVGAGTFYVLTDRISPPSSPSAASLARRRSSNISWLATISATRLWTNWSSKVTRSRKHPSRYAPASTACSSYLREMGALDYRLGSLEPLITLRDHGVGPAYVRELAELGHKGLSAEQLRQARDHGVAPGLCQRMRDAGFSALTIEQLINAWDHGISGDDARELGAVGLGKLPLEQLIRARDHGVGADYARAMRELGHRVSLDDLIRARDHGVDMSSRAP